MPFIEYYDFGEIVIDGVRYTRDLIITPKGVIANWWREEGHMLRVKDLKDVLNEDFEVLVIGTGYSGLMKVHPDVLEEMRRRGVEVIVRRTRDACKVHNELCSRGRKVITALHLTC